ncbi:MAG: non-canonical purine NTP pyrophosphatase [Pseudonocardiaceae bacterium]
MRWFEASPRRAAPKGHNLHLPCSIASRSTPTCHFLSRSGHNNARKFATAVEHLSPAGIELEQITLDLNEIQADSVTSVALHKAQQAFRALHRPIIIEDSGFYIDELDGFPGPFVKYVIKSLGAGGVARLADLTTTRTAISKASSSTSTPTAYPGSLPTPATAARSPIDRRPMLSPVRGRPYGTSLSRPAVPYLCQRYARRSASVFSTAGRSNPSLPALGSGWYVRTARM